MALSFRNQAITPAAPVSQWPTEAVHTALERGDLSDWHRLAAEIRSDPWGRTARQAEEVLTHARPYGLAEAMETVLARTRARAEATEPGLVAADNTPPGTARMQMTAGSLTSSSRHRPPVLPPPYPAVLTHQTVLA
jgi:hypothetical protein